MLQQQQILYLYLLYGTVVHDLEIMEGNVGLDMKFCADVHGPQLMVQICVLNKLNLSHYQSG